MAKEHQDLFKKGRAAYSLKFYKEKTLTKFLLDINNLGRRGLEKIECDKVKECLDEAISISSTLPNGSFFFKDFHEELIEFKKTYVKWNDIDEDANKPITLRQRLHDSLMDRRKALWEPFKKRIKKLNKAEKDKQLDLFQKLDKEEMDNMTLSFKPLVDDYSNLFPKLAQLLSKFKK